MSALEVDEKERQTRILERIVLGGHEDIAEKLKSNQQTDVIQVSEGEDDDASRPGSSDSGSEPEEIPIGRPRDIVDADADAEDGGAHDRIRMIPGRRRRKPGKTQAKIAAWVDDDDKIATALPKRRRIREKMLRSTDASKETISGLEYKARLKEEYYHNVGLGSDGPLWARPNVKEKRGSSEGSGSDESDDTEAGATDYPSDILRTTGSYIGSSTFLPKGILEFKALRDLTYGHRQRSCILRSVEFHKTAQIALTAGDGQRLQLFQVGKESPLLQSIAFDRYPINVAHFSANGERVLVGSRMHGHLFYYDMVGGGKPVKVPPVRSLNQQSIRSFIISADGSYLAILGSYGFIHLLSGKNYEFIHSLKMNGGVEAACFSPSSDCLYAHGDTGQVSIFDMRSQRCKHIFFDEGCVKGTALDISSDGKKVACGSNSGIVNLYEIETVTSSKTPQPLKTFPNLTTGITCLRFNPASELLAFGSDVKSNALRLAHLRSGTVIQNFPERRSRLSKPFAVDFSRNGGYMVISNDVGAAKLFRHNHYKFY